MAKILLVEDDATLALHVKDSLSGYGHQVDHVVDGAEGLYWLTYESYALAIVDWNLPGMEGIEICRRFRLGGGQTPILMLTGKTKDAEVVEGLDAGADDYLPKPFKMDVLRARLRALLRRHAAIGPNRIVVGPFELDQLSSEVFINGELIRPTRKEYAILELLIKEPGKYHSSTTILREAWPSGTEVSPDTVRSHITRLKSRIAAVSAEAAEMITSSYGLGYKLDNLSANENT